MSSLHPLSRLIAACEPGTPAGSESYVARQRPVAERLFQAIQPSSRMRALLVGQTGVGKSTELGRVAELANTDLHGFRVPIDEFLDLDAVTWHDILVFSACGIAPRFKLGAAYERLATALQPRRTTQEREIVRQPDSRRDVYGALASERSVERVRESVTGGPPEPTPLQRFRNNFQSVHETIESGRAQFWDLASSVISAAQAEAKKQFVLIWDGLEKMSLPSARRLFGDEGQYLSRLPSRIIVTAPLTLTFDDSFAQIEEHFSYVERLRAVSVESGGPGERFCLALLDKRGAREVCPEFLLMAAIQLSAGVPRQLLQIISYAAKQSLSDGQDQITEEALLRACNRLAEKWQYQLGPRDYAALAKADEDREPTERARLLQLGACIEHDRPEGGLQIDVNPLVDTLMTRRAARAAEGKGQRG